jgi:hypothetical protein
MGESNQSFSIEVEGMKAVCPLGEVVGSKMIAEGKIPVISCEGGCFRGEIARVAAHMVAKEEPYSRGCHGCHGRIMKNVVGHENMIQFDALRIYNKDNKYSNTMLVDEVPEAERKDLARQAADKILASLKDGVTCDSESELSCGCK